jgi:hypothetical protein
MSSYTKLCVNIYTCTYWNKLYIGRSILVHHFNAYRIQTFSQKFHILSQDIVHTSGNALLILKYWHVTILNHNKWRKSLLRKFVCLWHLTYIVKPLSMLRKFCRLLFSLFWSSILWKWRCNPTLRRQCLLPSSRFIWWQHNDPDDVI